MITERNKKSPFKQHVISGLELSPVSSDNKDLPPSLSETVELYYSVLPLSSHDIF